MADCPDDGDVIMASGPAPLAGLVSRRSALLGGAALLGAAAIGGHAVAQSATDRIAIQLYTLRDLLGRDLDGGLAALAAIGYRQVQQSDLFGRSPPDFRGALDAAGLSAPSGHLNIPQPFDAGRFERQLADAAIVGNTAVYHSYFGKTLLGPIRDRGSWERFAADLDAAARLAQSAGMRLGYHNHDAEFLPLDDASGETGMDVLLAGTEAGVVSFELDLYWLWHGAADPWAAFEKMAPRVTTYHVKDRTPEGRMADVGAGTIDFARVFAAHPAEQYIVERDDAGSFPRRAEEALDTARNSFAALTALLG